MRNSVCQKRISDSFNRKSFCKFMLYTNILYLQNYILSIHFLRLFLSYDALRKHWLYSLRNRSLGIRFASSSCLLLRKCLSASPVSFRSASTPPSTALRPAAFFAFWSSPRPISNSQLHTLPCFHLCPIYLVVFKGSYFFRMGYLILRGASRLDAFSVYPFPTWLPGGASGDAAGTPAVSPSRSSRTKDSSSQISCAHAG